MPTHTFRFDGEVISPAVLARRCDVETRTAQRWCARGRIEVIVTPTGHYKVRTGPDGLFILKGARPDYTPKKKRAAA